MRTLTFKISIGLLALMYLLPLHISAKKSKAEAEKTKTISKAYAVSAEHELEIRNKFGDVKITSWDKNQLEVEITITVGAKNEDKTQKRLDAIEIEIEEGKEASSFKTKISEGNQKWNNENGKIQIDYIIKMPATNELELRHSFGALELNELTGKAEIRVDFGNVNIGKLTHPESEVEFKFCDPVTIDYMEAGELEVSYSKMDLTSAKKLKIDSEFSGSNIEKIEDADVRIKFGSVKLDEVKNVKIVSNMSKVSIDDLHGKGDFETKYGKLQIGNVAKDFTSLEIDAEFAPVEVKIENGAEMEVDLYASMGGISVPNKSWTRMETDSNNKSYKGNFGSSNRTVNIRSSFGKINLDF